MKIAIVESKPSRNNYVDVFGNAWPFEQYSLASDPELKKVLKKDVDIDMDPDKFDWIILVGAEPLKFYTKATKVMEYSGTLVDDKFLPLINPAMVSFKPETKRLLESSVDNIKQYISGDKKKAEIGENFIGIQDEQEALDYIQQVLDSNYDFFGIDSETSGLYPRDGHILGISLCGSPDTGAYIDADVISEEVEEKLQELFTWKRAVFHNAKFDIPMFEYHFNVSIPRFEDTMLMHYVIDERPGYHGLKQLAMKYTDYGDYEKAMYEWMEQYRKEHGIRKDDFKWEWIPFDVMKNYAAIDATVTFMIFQKFERALLGGNPKLLKVYNDILIPACRFLMKVQDNGVPFDRARLAAAQSLLTNHIQDMTDKLFEMEEVKSFHEDYGEFNANSVIQLRKLFFDYIGLKPTGIMTEKGAHSLGADALAVLSKEHEVPSMILDIRKDTKLKNTYIDKIIPQLNKDSRLRTNFNLHGTVAGRLSSSGKMNMQQIPRDNPIVKGCIKAPPGRKIVAMDLTTAEIYIAAVLSKDKKLQAIFKAGTNFHSTVAKDVFNLPCEVEEVADLYPDYRQATKAVNFGIIYGAGAPTISTQVNKDGGNLSVGEAQEIIDQYFKNFRTLKAWIDRNKALIASNGHVYSHFGRKRRLPDVQSDNKGTVAHAIRSGLNFIVQSPASDVNLIGAMEAQEIVESDGLDANMFALVHDSVLADVAEEHVDVYSQILQTCIQRDRGISIPGCPIGCDFDIGDDYSFGKFEKTYVGRIDV